MTDDCLIVNTSGNRGVLNKIYHSNSLTFHLPLITMSGGRSLTLASRPSKLAVIQTESVLAALQSGHTDMDLKTRYISSAGDKNQTDALYLMGGKSVWTEELEAALLDGSVDLLVHSLKDVPTTLPAGVEIGAMLEREDPADALVMKDGLSFKTLNDLPDGSVIGTSSLRRVAQLRRSHPKLKYIDVVSLAFNQSVPRSTYTPIQRGNMYDADFSGWLCFLTSLIAQRHSSKKTRRSQWAIHRDNSCKSRDVANGYGESPDFRPGPTDLVPCGRARRPRSGNPFLRF